MEITMAKYPISQIAFARILTEKNETAKGMSLRIGYSGNALGEAFRRGEISRRMAVALQDAYGISPEDYAPRPEPKEEPKPMLDRVLLPDGVYTLEFVDVRPGRRTGDMAEGWRFVTVAEDGQQRTPYYFSLYDRKPGGEELDLIGSCWIQHLLRVAMGADYCEGMDVRGIIGRKVKAYVMIYEKGDKRYNRTVWVEPMKIAGGPQLTDVINWQTSDRTLAEAVQCIGDILLDRLTKE